MISGMFSFYLIEGYSPTLFSTETLDMCIIYLKNKSYLTETMNILIIFDRSFFTESIVVITSILPIRPIKIKTNASIAPINVTCRVGCLDN